MSAPLDAPWPPEKMRELCALWTEGRLSAAEIGRRLAVSKNAVLGKAHRLGLAGRPSPIRRDGASPTPPRPATPRRLTGPTLPLLAGAMAASTPAAASAPAPPRRKSRGCLWPTWTVKDAAYWAAIRRGETLECGDPLASIDDSYCAAHARVAYTKPAR